MTDSMSPDRKRLLYRAMHRGFKEADIVIGRFAAAHLSTMSETELADFAVLLDVPDQDLYAWVIGRAPTPDNFRTPVMARLQAFDVAATMGS